MRLHYVFYCLLFMFLSLLAHLDLLIIENKRGSSCLFLKPLHKNKINRNRNRKKNDCIIAVTNILVGRQKKSKEEKPKWPRNKTKCGRKWTENKVPKNVSRKLFLAFLFSKMKDNSSFTLFFFCKIDLIFAP